MTNSNDFRIQTTGNLCLLIIARLIAEYKHSNEALAALENFLLGKNIRLQAEPPIL